MVIVSIAQVESTIPPELAALTGVPKMARPSHIWATLLAMASAETMDFCWLAEEDVTGGDDDLTMVDKAARFLSLQPPALRKILPELHVKAHEVVGEWQRNQEERIRAVRLAQRAVSSAPKSLSEAFEVRCCYRMPLLTCCLPRFPCALLRTTSSGG